MHTIEHFCNHCSIFTTCGPKKLDRCRHDIIRICNNLSISCNRWHITKGRNSETKIYIDLNTSFPSRVRLSRRQERKQPKKHDLWHEYTCALTPMHMHTIKQYEDRKQTELLRMIMSRRREEEKQHTAKTIHHYHLGSYIHIHTLYLSHLKHIVHIIYIYII